MPTGTGIPSLFDRAGKYEELIKAVEGLRAGFGISEPSAIARFSTSSDVNSKLSALLDFFGSRQRSRLHKCCAYTEGEIRKRMFPDAPNSGRLTQTGRYYFNALGGPANPSWPIGSPPLGSSGASSTRRRA